MTVKKKPHENGMEILVVEDSPTQAEQLRYFLEQQGFRVSTASNGVQALALLAASIPQLVISDIVMPEMDGYALCRAIKADNRLENLPVILMTALSDVNDVLQGLECGADNFIRKPYDKKYLLARVDYLLMNHEMRKKQRLQVGMEIYLSGKKHFISAERQQILDMLISVYEEAVRINEDLKAREKSLALSNRVISSLYLIATGLNHAASEQEVVDCAVDNAMKLPGIRAGWIAVLDGKSGFRNVASRNLPTALQMTGAMEGTCLCQQQLLSGELHAPVNVSECERLRSAQSSLGETCLHASIPISIGDNRIGVMNLLLAGERTFGDDELQMLHGIGNQVAVALARVQLHEQLEYLVEKRTAALAASEARFAGILDIAHEAIISIDEAEHIVLFNQGAEKTFGYAGHEVIGKSVEMLMPEKYRKGHHQHIQDFATGPERSCHMGEHLEISGLRQNGQIFPCEASISKIVVNGEKIFTVVLRDITERRAHEARILRLNRIYAVLSGINTAIVHIRDREQLLPEACRVATEAGGFTLAWIGMADTTHQKLHLAACSGDSEGYLEALTIPTTTATPEGQGPAGIAYRENRVVICNDIASDGRMTPWRERALARNLRAVAVFPLFVLDKVAAVFTLYADEPGFFDAEELKLLTEMAGDIAYALENIEKERQLNYLAFYDKVTDLPNRALLLDRLNQSLPQAKQRNKILAIILIDIDRFKFINDSLGYQAGDILLKKVAERLGSLVHSGETVSRGVGDEFVLMMTDIGDVADIANFIVEGILAPLAKPFEIRGSELRITVKVGISVFPADADSAETLLKHSEIALDKAKQFLNTFLFYSPEMNASVARMLTIENKLHKAIEEREFLLHYQPKLELASGRICGIEALIRWQDPDVGLVAPSEFIPVLEETGMILVVGRWVIETVCDQIRQWQEQGLAVPTVAVNVSSLQLTQGNFVEDIVGLLEAYGIDGKFIEFEITESVIMQEVAASIGKLEALRGLGCTITIDDFGTGYSSLSYLTQLPLSRLKIDKSFTDQMLENADSMTIVSSVIALSHGLNLKVIAEGVETEEQLKMLRLLKCDEIQGYFAHRPLPIKELEEVLFKRSI